jgi:flagellar export protein FliJ
MKKYQFPLGRLLELRRMQVEMARVQYQRQLGEVREQDEMRREISRQINAAGEAALREGASGVERAGAGNFREYARRADAAVAVEQKRAVVAAEALRQGVVLAEQKVAALEMLDERGQRVWRKQLAAEVEQFAAESYLGRWKRRVPAEEGGK